MILIINEKNIGIMKKINESTISVRMNDNDKRILKIILDENDITLSEVTRLFYKYIINNKKLPNELIATIEQVAEEENKNLIEMTKKEKIND